MENERIEKIKNTILWVISIFLMLSMLVYMGQATTQAILMEILGLLIMPPINKKINEKIINGNKKKHNKNNIRNNTISCNSIQYSNK